jgi:hypothetical protein
MKNILNYKVFTAALGLVLFSSCNNNDEETYQNTVKSIVTASTTSLNIAEGNSSSVTLTLDKALNIKTDLKIEVSSGTGVFRDFEVTYGANEPIDIETATDDGWGLIGYKLTIPAYTTSFTFDISSVLDVLPEGTENIVLKLSTAGNGVALVDSASQFINLTIPNTVVNNFVATLEWDGKKADAHGTINPTSYTTVEDKVRDYCTFDFDLEIYDTSLSNVLYQDYDNCPAECTIDAADPDGDYVIVPSFWSRGTTAQQAVYAPKSGEIIFPVKVTMSKPGKFTHTTNLSTGQFKYSTGGAVQGYPDAYVPIAVVTKTGTNYVLTDYNTLEELGSGRHAYLLNKLKNLKRNKK